MDTVTEQTFSGGPDETSLEMFLASRERAIIQHLQDTIDRHRSIKYFIKIDIAFNRLVDDMLQTSKAAFFVPIQVLTSTENFDIDDAKATIMTAIEHYNERGSNWLFDHVIKLVIRSAPYRPLQGSSFVKTPKELFGKRAIINVQNDDSICFLYSITLCNTIFVPGF